MKNVKIALVVGLFAILGLNTPSLPALDYEVLVRQAADEYLRLAPQPNFLKQKNMEASPWNFCRSGFSLNVTLGSHHSGGSQKNFNEKNLGGGIRCHLNEIAYVEGNLIPRNSMRGIATTFGPGASWKLYEENAFSFSAGGTIQVGVYENPTREKFRIIPVGGPTFSLGFGQTSIGVLIIPKKNPIYIFGVNHRFD